MTKLIFAIGLMLTSLFFTSCRGARPSAEEMEKQIARQLPLGSNKTQVVAFLDSRRISHSDIQDFFELDEAHQRIKTRIITASIPRNSFWTKSQVLMVFYFDD